MKLICTVLLLLVSLSSLFSQEFIKNAKVNFKDKTFVEGDYYYYPSIPNTVQVLDSNGKKSVYPISDIDFVEGETSILRNLEYQGQHKLFECLVEGEKFSLYKTDANDRQELYALKDHQMSWLEGGKKEIEEDSKRYTREIVTYKGILKVLMNDNAALAKQVDNITFSERAITDLVVAYNEGQASYIKSREKVKINRKPDWKIYTGYSNYSKYSKYPLDFSPGSFNQLGAEYFFSKGSRHSIKVGLEYGKFFNKDSTIFQNERRLVASSSDISCKYFNVNFGYYLDFYRRPKCNLYVDVKLVNVGALWGDSGKKFVIAPAFIPGFGFEYHLSNKLDVFGEIDHFIILEHFPYNFLVGLTFDI